MENNLRIQRAEKANRLLFSAPGEGGKLVFASGVARCLADAFAAVRNPQETNSASAADYLNALCRELNDEMLDAVLEELIFSALVELKVLPGELQSDTWSENTSFLLQQAQNLLAGAGELAEACQDELFPRTAEQLRRVNAPEDLHTLAGQLLLRDRFRRNRAFQFHNGKFLPVELTAAKPIAEFYGFPSVRAQFESHFADFASGKSNLPLLVNSLPGYGKTSMTVSHCAAHDELVLILPEPETLEHNWRELIAPLAARPDHKFVVFFDDIDPRVLDWYQFRTNVGGAFAPPDNVLLVVAANYEFPANILSRGRKVSYPVFDELRCMEMVEEFLNVKFNMKSPSRNLISLIAAGYTEDFGQKKFTELSPRSLIRYLKVYETDQIKRKTVVELSFGKMIFKPDAQLFYEFNIELMRSLYGEEYIQQLLRERLRDMEK